MGYKILIMVLPILFAGCSKQMHFSNQRWDSAGNLMEETKVRYIGAAGSSNMEGIEATIGSEDKPLAKLKVRSSTVDMDEFYDAVTEMTQLMEMLALKYPIGGL